VTYFNANLARVAIFVASLSRQPVQALALRMIKQSLFEENKNRFL